jgi:hypothetical protein
MLCTDPGMVSFNDPGAMDSGALYPGAMKGSAMAGAAVLGAGIFSDGEVVVAVEGGLVATGPEATRVSLYSSLRRSSGILMVFKFIKRIVAGGSLNQKLTYVSLDFVSTKIVRFFVLTKIFAL